MNCAIARNNYRFKWLSNEFKYPVGCTDSQVIAITMWNLNGIVNLNTYVVKRTVHLTASPVGNNKDKKLDKREKL